MSEYSGTDNLEVMAEAVKYNEFLARQVASMARPGDYILDFGAGIGTFAQRMAGAGHDVVCLEPDPSQAQRLRAAGLAVRESLTDIADNSLDYIYTLNVLEHIEDDQSVLAGLARKLKRGGRLLIYVPAFALLYSSMDHKVGHLRRYRRRGLLSQVAAAGFAEVVARDVDSLGFFAALAYRISGNSSGAINMRMLKFYDRYLFPASRIADNVFGKAFGKNILLTARKG
jgi:2-polyprenyl-3-methyl-5-hydroxy-6-metoxy-1,4-benzoquinol methylase